MVDVMFNCYFFFKPQRGNSFFTLFKSVSSAKTLSVPSTTRHNLGQEIINLHTCKFIRKDIPQYPYMSLYLTFHKLVEINIKKKILIVIEQFN